MNKLFIGREKEQRLLKEYIASDQSEFVAVYGRRRVGKTFLIQQVVGEDYVFYAAGMHKVPMRIQLANFMQGIKKHNPKVKGAKTWLEAFMALETYLERGMLIFGRTIRTRMRLMRGAGWLLRSCA